MDLIEVSSSHREQMVDITAEVQKLVAGCGRADGVCHLFTQHTTCGLTINENADPDVKSDMLGFLRKLIPQYEPDFRHFEHNSDAHIKSSLVGSSVSRAIHRRQTPTRPLAGNLPLRIRRPPRATGDRDDDLTQPA